MHTKFKSVNLGEETWGGGGERERHRWEDDIKMDLKINII
jgi:hypothetical protein